jgi:ATP-dependent Lhr-like helicase
MGDKVVNTITAMLVKAGHAASAFAGIVEVEKTNSQTVIESLKKLCLKGTLTNTELANIVPEKVVDKYDDLLPEALLIEGYGQKYFDVDNSILWLKKHLFFNSIDAF